MHKSKFLQYMEKHSKIRCNSPVVISYIKQKSIIVDHYIFTYYLSILSSLKCSKIIARDLNSSEEMSEKDSLLNIDGNTNQEILYNTHLCNNYCLYNSNGQNLQYSNIETETIQLSDNENKEKLSVYDGNKQQFNDYKYYNVELNKSPSKYLSSKVEKVNLDNTENIKQNEDPPLNPIEVSATIIIKKNIKNFISHDDSDINCKSIYSKGKYFRINTGGNILFVKYPNTLQETCYKYNIMLDYPLNFFCECTRKFSGTIRYKDQSIKVEDPIDSISIDFIDPKYKYTKNKVFKTFHFPLTTMSSEIIPENSEIEKIIIDRKSKIDHLKFINDNTLVSLREIYPFLLCLEIQPSLFLSHRILSFYNNDISSLSLSLDFLWYSIYCKMENIIEEVDRLLDYTKDSIIENTGDRHILHLYDTLIFILNIYDKNESKQENTSFNDNLCGNKGEKVIHNKGKRKYRMKYLSFSNNKNFREKKKSVEGDCKVVITEKVKELDQKKLKREFFHENSKNIGEIKNYIDNSIKGFNGIERLAKITSLIQEYFIRGILLDKEYLKKILDVKIDDYDVLSHCILMKKINSMGKSYNDYYELIDHTNSHAYKTFISKVTEKFCYDLNKGIKKGSLDISIYQHISKIVDIIDDCSAIKKGIIAVHEKRNEHLSSIESKDSFYMSLLEYKRIFDIDSK